VLKTLSVLIYQATCTILAIIIYIGNPLQKRVKNEFTAKFAVIGEYSSKSITFIQNRLFLLRLPEASQQAIREGKTGLSQGCLFAENINHPALLKISNNL